jgi:uncharacterized damage-inducible protein DinB
MLVCGMTDPCYPFRRLARSALLSNARLQAACAALQPGEWDAPRVSFFPSLKATLNHILVIDRFYVDAVQGGTLGPAAWADPEPCATVEDLAKAQVAMDRTVVGFCDGLLAADLDRAVQIHRTGRVQVETLADTLMHIFLHDQHHRGQAHAMLSGTSVKPPQLDEFLMADDARFRDADLAATGWDEGVLSR